MCKSLLGLGGTLFPNEPPDRDNSLKAIDIDQEQNPVGLPHDFLENLIKDAGPDIRIPVNTD